MSDSLPNIINLDEISLADGQVADRMASTLGARAFVEAGPLFFGPEGYDVGTTAEMRHDFVAHEATHVVQQGSSGE